MAPPCPTSPRRRTFTAGYKMSIVEAYEACACDGDKGALLRWEGLYFSHGRTFVARPPD